ncbi:MAG TPA: DinB family protein [Candidatus Acidoferrales bacterium]|jgi:hypothetical protein|nr:DinB family protein [Candidatus Acidoferrales bacterium]
MKTFAITVAMMLSAAGAAQAQNPLSAELKRFYEGSKMNLMRSAEQVPEADYSFKPAPTVRTFGEEVAHAAEFQMVFCAGAKGESPTNPAAGKTSKADLIAALKASSDYCDAVYDSMTDATLPQMIKMFNRDFTKQGALYLNVIHNNETYGTMVPYMRIKGLVPPSSQPRTAGKKQ